MKRIGIVPVSDGSGAGLVTAMLAAEAAADGGESGELGRITAVELGRGNLYDQLCADRWFRMRQLVSYWNCLYGEGRTEKILNPQWGVNWFLRTPEDREKGELDRVKAVKLLYSLPGDVALIDFSSVGSEVLFELMDDMDQLVAVVDPLPSRLLQGYERMYRLKLRKPPVHWVVNRWNDGVDGKEMKKILGAERNWISLPELPRELLCQAEYSGFGLAGHPQIRSAMAPGMEQLLRRLRI